MDFGAELRQAREKRGISLREIATVTKISPVILEALETNNVSRLPGGIFTRAFVRLYAAEVGLNPELTVQKFLEEFPEDDIYEQAPNTGTVDMFGKRRKLLATAGRLAFWGFGVVILLVYLTSNGEENSVQPQGRRSDEEIVAPNTVRRSPLPSNDLVDRSRVEPIRITSPLMIDIQPKGLCWVSLTLDGESSFARLMQVGERETGHAEREIVVTVGDAGTFGFTINHRQGLPLGESGEVVTARISLDNLNDFLTQ